MAELNCAGAGSLAPLGAAQGLGCKCLMAAFLWLPGTCLDDSWIHPQNLTPSFPKHVQVQVRWTLTQHGDLIPVLHIEWTLKTDGEWAWQPGSGRSSTATLVHTPEHQLPFRFRMGPCAGRGHRFIQCFRHEPTVTCSHRTIPYERHSFSFPSILVTNQKARG